MEKLDPAKNQLRGWSRIRRVRGRSPVQWLIWKAWSGEKTIETEGQRLVSYPTRWSLYWPLALCIDPPINRETEYSNVLAPSSTLFQSLISIRCPYHWDAHLSTKHIFVFFLLSRVWIHVYFLLMMPITRVDHICETDQMWFNIFLESL